MKIVGIIREFDSTGRISLPMEMRKQIWGQDNRKAEIFATEKGILIKPYSKQKVPVVHGNIVYRHYIPHCSICDKVLDANSCYCKWCGAKMEGGAE